MLQSLFNVLFGCSHQRTTFPLTPGRRNAGATPTATLSATYVVCLDCGTQFAYNWKTMQVGEQMTPPPPAGEVQPTYRYTHARAHAGEIATLPTEPQA